jgi:hypothetical protein
LISLHLLNNVGDFCQDSSDICQKLIAFLTENFQWMNDQIKSNIDDPYWNQVMFRALTIKYSSLILLNI